MRYALQVLIVLMVASMAACGDKHMSQSEIETMKKEAAKVDFYERMLMDKEFTWNGPTSHEDRIPWLPAARALAAIGDPAVPALLRAIENESIDIVSVYDALSEIGLPAYEYRSEIYQRKASGISNWWKENRDKTRSKRSARQVRIGLPPLLIGEP